MSRLHNDANILVIGGRVVGKDLAREIVRMWFATSFEGGRHIKRLNKIRQIEERMRQARDETGTAKNC
jgi:ribose 5-phosphate isomerase B